MASYIFTINPNDDTIYELTENNIVTWPIPTSHTTNTTLKRGDVLFIYLTAYGNKSGHVDNMALESRIGYKGTIISIGRKAFINNRYQTYVSFRPEELSFDSSEKLTLENLKVNCGFKPPLGHILSLETQGQAKLKDYINDMISSNKLTCELTYENQVISLTQKYNDIFKKRFDNTTYSGKKAVNKLSGNITTMLIKKYIELVLDKYNLPYKVSEQNSFVNGSRTEYDLFILKESAYNILDLNIYSPNDVIVIIEIKTSGLFGTLKKVKGKRSLKEDIEKILGDFETVHKINNKVKFAYITYSERNIESKKYGGKDYLSETREHLKDSSDNDRVFCFHPTIRNKNLTSPNKFSWEEFILNLLP